MLDAEVLVTKLLQQEQIKQGKDYCHRYLFDAPFESLNSQNEIKFTHLILAL